MFNNFLPNYSIQGEYENINFEQSIFHPQTEDTLQLFGNNEFYSSNHGYGKYELEYKLTGTEIIFHGDFNFHTSINRSWFAKPRIHMFYDLNHHYQKISSRSNIDNAAIEKYKIERKKREEQIQWEMNNIIQQDMR